MITQKLNNDIISAMKNKEATTLGVLRQIKNAISNAALNSGNVGNNVNDLEVISIIRKQIAQRQDSIAQFQKGGRSDLVDNEQKEIAVLEKYLPDAMSEDQIKDLINQAILDTGAQTKKDMGKAIKRAVELSNGRVDNKTISQKIGELL